MFAVAVLTVSLVAAAAPQEGVLLGVTTPDGALSTYFVDAKGATRLGRGLAVPRKGGVWIVDVSDGELEEAWVRPAKDGAPKFWAPPPPRPKTSSDVLTAADAGRGDAGAACEATNHIQVRFASPELLTLSQHAGTDCTDGGPGDQVTLVQAYGYDEKAGASPNFLVKPASIDVLGKGARNALALAAQEEQEKDPCLGEPADSEWLIVRSDGEWGLMGHLGARDATCRGAESSFDVDSPLPETIVGASKPVNREKLLAEDKDFADAVASPSGRTVVVLENKRLVVRVDGKQVAASPLTEAEANLGIVMAQWASGQKNVERSRADASKALRAPMAR